MRLPVTARFAVSGIALTAAVVMAASGCTTTSEAPPTADREAVAALVEAWTAFWNSYDLDAVDDLFLADSSLTYFSSEREGLLRGIAAVREHHAGFDFVPGGRTSDTRLWLEEVGIDLFADSAIVTGLWYFTRTGEEGVQRGPVTALCVRTPAGWRIAHMNFSTYRDDDAA